MEGKKRYIAIILFLLICLMVFTFATTSDEELEGTGNNIQEITDKDTSEKDDKKEETKSEEKEESKKENNNSNNTNSNSTNKDSESSADDEENLDGTGEVDNSAYDKALEAVEELEKLLTDAQADIARDLVEEVTNSDQYKELVERIEDAEDAIDAEELVAKLEAMVKEAAEKADITDAKDFRDEEVTDAVNEIDGENLEAVKEDLLDRIEELSKILDDNNEPTIDGIKDGEYTNLDEISLTIADENEVTIKVTKDGNEIDFAEKFTEEGTYEVTVVDAAFNDVTKTFTIDRTQPKFEGLTSGQHYDIIKLDVKDASPVKITISKDHAKEVAIENGTEIKEDGTYRIVATDEAGNKKEIWVAIDSTLPTITPDVEYTNVKGQKVTIADKFLMTVTINGKEYTRSDFAKDKNNENFSMEYTLEEDGEYTIVAKDKKGLTVEKTIILDTVKPKFENLASREVDTDYYKVDVTDVTPVKIYVSKNHKAFEEIQEGYELTEEATYQLKAVDAAGNEYTTWIHIDKTAPSITVTPDKEYMNVCPTIEVFDRYLSKVTIDGKVYDRKDFTKNSSNENFKLNVTLEDCEDGLHTITAVDKRGLETTKTFVYDKTKPQITGVENGAYYNHDVTPVIIEENLQNVAIFKDDKKYTKYTVGMTLTEEGVYRMRASDKAGNKFDYITFTIDKTAPTARSNWWKKTLEADKNATFTDFPVFTPSEEATVEYVRGEVNMGKPGVYRIRYRITDLAKNSKDYEVQVTVVDTTPAKITLPFPIGRETYEYRVESGTKVTLKDITATVIDNVDEDSKLEPYYADLLIGKKEENTYNYDLSQGINTNYAGRYNIKYKYKDAAGNVSELTLLLFMKDTTKPTLEITEKGKMVYVRGKDVTRLKYNIIKDGKTVHTVDSETCNCGNYFSITWLAKEHGDGEYTIEVVDAGGNKATATAFVDTTAPVATPSYTEKTIEINSVKEFTDFPTFEVTDNSNKEVKQELISGSVDTTKLGTYELTYKFTDYKTNSSEVTVTVKVVDTTAPVAKPSYTEKTVVEDSVEEFTDFPTFEISDNSKGNVKQELISGSVNIHKVGTYELRYRFTDESGNYTDKTITIKVVDKTAPTITGIEDGAYYNTKDTHAIPVASDKNGAILMVKTTLGDVELKTILLKETEMKLVGTYTVYAVDIFGNKSKEYTVHIDPYAPKILVLDRIENISGAYLPIKPVILEHNIDKIEVTLNGKPIDYKAGDQLTKDGKYTMTVTDKANNSTTVEFTMDSVAPTMLVSPTSLGVVDSLDLNDSNNITGLLIDEEAEFQLMKVEKNITVLDKDIPIYKYTKLPENGIIDEEGQYILIAYDKAYNVTAYKFIVDRSAPIVNVEEGKYYSSVTINVEDPNMATGSLEDIKDLIPGLGSLIPSLDKLIPSITIQKGNDWLSIKSIENGYVVDEDGTYTLVAKDAIAVNPLFSEEEQAAHTTTVTFHIDTKKPTTNVVEGGVYKKVTVSVDDAHLDEESITINGKKYDGKEITEEGNYVLKAKDLAGNELVVNFEVDKTPITISGAKEFNNSSVEVEVNSKDENPTIELNGVEVGKEFTASTEGINEVVVVDKWGNSETVTFTIDTIKPVINNPVKLINEKTTVGAVKGTSIPVVATVTDANPTETEVLPIVSHDKLGDLGQLSSISTTKAEVGTYTLIYNTVDKAGHAAKQVKLYVEVFVDDYVLSFNNIKTEYNYGETIPSLTFADLKLVSDEETIALADGDITFDKKTSDMVKVGTYTVEAELTKVIDEKQVVRTATITFEIKPIQAKITFVKTDGYGEINGDTGTFQYEFDGNSNPFTATVEGILDADKDDIVVTVTYNKNELKPGIGFKATATINNDNYYLKGDTFNFDIMKATATVELPTEIDGKVTVTNRNGIDISKYAAITRDTDGKATGTQTNEECKEWGFFKCNEYETVTKNIQIDYTTIQVKSNDYMNVATKNIDLGDIINDILEEKGINIPGLSNAIDYEKIIQLLDLAKHSMIGDAVEAIEVPTEGTSRVYITNVDITEIK